MSPLGQFLFILIGILRFHKFLFNFYIIRYLAKAFLQIALTVALVTLISWGISYLLVPYTLSNIEKHNRFDIFNDSDDEDEDDEDDDDEDDDDEDNDPDYQVDDSESSDDDDYEIDNGEIDNIKTSNFLIENIDKGYNVYVNKYDEDKNDNVFIDRLYSNEIVALVDRANGTAQTPLFKVVEQIDEQPSKYRIKLHQFKDNNNKVYYGFLANAEPAWWTRDGLCLDLDASVLIDENTGDILHNFSLIHTVV